LEGCTSLCWNVAGNRLFGGFSDGAIEVWDVEESAMADE